MRKILMTLLIGMVTSLADAQLSSNPDKFLGNIPTFNQMDAGGGVPKFYELWNQVTPESGNGISWGDVEGTRGQYNWSNVDNAYNYAKQYNFPFKFPALVWGAHFPKWLVNLSADERYKAIEKWMDAVKEKYPDLELIDVVNEAIGTHQSGNPMMKESLGGGGKTGYDWLIKAFEMAHERWPNAILIYNDYNSLSWNVDDYITLVQTLRDAGAPIDAYGNQAHDVNYISENELSTVLKKQQDALKMPMFITQLDIAEPDDAQQKVKYQKVLPLMWEAPYCAGVTLWGYVYGATWVDNSGLYKNGKERAAMTWIKEYMETNAAKKAKSPFPGMVKEASVYIKPRDLKVPKGEKLPIKVCASMATKTIEKIDLYMDDNLIATMTEAPFLTEYAVPSNFSTGRKNLKAVVRTTDGAKYERYGGFSVCDSRSAYNGVKEVPDTIEAEDFDGGAEGYTYHDSDNINEGDAKTYRTDGGGVDIVTGNGGTAIGITTQGEWLEYTIDVAIAGECNYEAIVSCGSADGSALSISLIKDNVEVELAKLNIPMISNNNWDEYKALEGKLSEPLELGKQILRITIDKPGVVIDKLIIKSPDSGACGDNVYYAYDKNTGTLVISGSGDMYNYSVGERPWKDKIDIIKKVLIEDGVTSIGDSAFFGCSGLTSVTIPNSVTSIGYQTFFGCSGLTSVAIPTAVTSIGDEAFFGCSGLISVTIPESVASIGYRTFFGCSGLTSVTIPNSVTYIGDKAFSGCSGLTSVTIPNSVTSIGDEAFSGCSGLISVNYLCSPTSIGFSIFLNCTNIQEVTFDCKKVPSLFRGKTSITKIATTDKVTTIDDYAFEYCSGLTSVTIPNSVTSIGNSAFNGCSGLTSVSYLCSPKSVGIDVFSNCYNIKEVTFDCEKVPSLFKGKTSISKITMTDKVTTIDAYAFGYCSGLTSVIIPNSVTSIGSRAFQYCRSLSSVVIGSGVISIDPQAFDNTNLIKTIWLTNTPPSGSNYASGYVNYVSNDQYNISNRVVYPFLSSYFDVDGIRYVPVSLSERICDAIDCVYNESAENTKIPATAVYKGITMTVKNIQPYLAYGNKYIKTLTIDNDGDIAKHAFKNCSNMTSATLGANVSTINEGAFESCSNLTSVTLGANVSVIGESAFHRCSVLESIVIQDEVKSIGSYAFSDCLGLKSANLGNGVENVNQYAFSGCSSLKELTIGSQVKTIDQYAFQDCKALSYVTIPQAVTEINNYVFSGCTLLNKVIIDDSEEELKLGSNGSNPIFSSCPLDSVYIGRNISYKTSSNCGYSPFYRNTSLRAVKITDKETDISTNEFYGCTNLQRVIIGDGVTTIGNWAFSGCSSLNYFAFGSSMKTIGKEAFSDCTAMTRLYSKAVTPPVCGSQALDDINKWNCKLLVPNDCIATYQAADQWKEFIFIEENGYEGIISGDVNDDGTINAADIVEVVNYIMGNRPDNFNVANADANGDGTVNAADIVAIVNIIMGK